MVKRNSCQKDRFISDFRFVLQLCQLADFYEITGFKISRYEDNKRLLHIRLQEGKVFECGFCN